jgi:glutathione S-transferase
VPAVVRPLVAKNVRRRVRKLIWQQGLLRHSEEDIFESARRDWRAVLSFMSEGPFFFGDEPTGLDAIVFGALATSVLTPIDSPIRDFLRLRPACVAYAERMLARFFPELSTSWIGPVQARSMARAVQGAA